MRGLAKDGQAHPVPNDSRLRNELEPIAFDQLAVEVLRLGDMTHADLQALRQRDAPSHTSDSRADTPRAKVLVIGSAVMDILFRLPTSGLPAPDTSVQVESFGLEPGGKGLTQAVAAARLGLDVWLAAAIGDDEFGNQIVTFLTQNGVHTELLKIVPGGQTPVTGVIAEPTGTSVALGWKNEAFVRLDPADISSGKVYGQFQLSDFVFLTFEPPSSTVNEAISVAAKIQEIPRERPMRLFVTPAPPLGNSHALIPGETHAVSILIANTWECQMLTGWSGEITTEQAIGELATMLLRMGIQQICIPSDGQCFFYSNTGEHIAVPAWPVFKHDNTGERDALAAALAYQIGIGAEISTSTLRWATAAMAASSQRPGVAASMPTQEQVARIVQQFADISSLDSKLNTA